MADASVGLLVAGMTAFVLERPEGSRRAFGVVGRALLALAWIVITAGLTRRWAAPGLAAPGPGGLLFLTWAMLGACLLFGRHLPCRSWGLWAALGSLTLLLASSHLYA